MTKIRWGRDLKRGHLVVQAAKTLSVNLLACLAVGQASALSCVKPSVPPLSFAQEAPNIDEFNALTNALRAYDAENQTYQECLDQIISAPQSVDRAVWLAALSAYNAIAPEQEALNQAYLAAGNAFRAAQAERAADAASQQTERATEQATQSLRVMSETPSRKQE
jgi:hypothetical protein